MSVRNLLLFISAWIFGSCDSDFFPGGLYDYQIERLLSGGDSKVWNQVVNSTDCQDSVKLLIELVSSSSDDSIAVSLISYNFGLNELPNSSLCQLTDTVLLGNADASSFSDALLFTDSLNFSNGDFWIIKEITAQRIEILNSLESTFYLSQ